MQRRKWAPQLRRYFSVILINIFFLISLCRSAYSFDINGLDLSIMEFLDSLSVNYKGFDIKVSGIQVAEEFDDNVAFSDEAELEDYITNAGIGAGVKYEGKTMALELLGSITQQFFAKNPDFNNLTHDVTLSFKDEFSEQSRISFSNNFNHSDAPLFSTFRDRLFTETEEVIDFRYSKNRFNMEYSNDINGQLTVVARYANDIDTFAGVANPTVFQNKAGLEADYLFSPATTLLFSYDFANRHFEGEGDASINTVAPGVKRQITDKLLFDGKAGVHLIDSFDRKDHARPVIQTSLTYDMDENTQARLLFVRKVDTNPFTQDIFDSWRVRASFKRKMSERLEGSLSLSYGVSEFISSGFMQTSWDAEPAFTYEINQYLKGDMTYRYDTADSNIATAGFTKNTVILGLTAEF